MDMDSLLLTGGAVCLLAFGFLLFRQYQQKAKIGRARELVKLSDTAGHMDFALKNIPEEYQNNRFRSFLLERKVTLMTEYIKTSGHQLPKQKKRLEQDRDLLTSLKSAPPKEPKPNFAEIKGPKVASALKGILKTVHEQIKEAQKSNNISVKEAKLLMVDIKRMLFRLLLDLYVSDAKKLQQAKNYGASIARFRQALGYFRKHPLKADFKTLELRLEEMVAGIEKEAKDYMSEKRAESEGTLTQGIDDLEKDEQNQMKSQVYDE